jgi:hypothetical protein
LHETEAAHQRLDHFTCAALQAHRMQVRILEVTVCAGARLMLLLLDGHDAAWVAHASAGRIGRSIRIRTVTSHRCHPRDRQSRTKRGAPAADRPGCLCTASRWSVGEEKQEPLVRDQVTTATLPDACLGADQWQPRVKRRCIIVVALASRPERGCEVGAGRQGDAMRDL